MSLYAQVPTRRARQVAGDALVAVWVLGWVVVGRAVRDAVARLGDPGRTLESAGRSLGDGLRSAAGGVARLPVVGDDLRGPFDAAGEGAATLARAGVDLQAGAGRAGLLAGVAVAAWPIAVVAGGWLLHRVRGARRADVARRVLAAQGGTDLLALRALAGAPLSRLAAVGPDPAAAWRRGDRGTVEALAALTLHELGLRHPGARPAPPAADVPRRG